MTTLYAYANPRGAGGLYAGDATSGELIWASVDAALVAQAASVVGMSDRGVQNLDNGAVLAAQAATVVGDGDRGVQDTDSGASDDLQAQAATVVGAGLKIHYVIGSGAASSRSAGVVGGSAFINAEFGLGDLGAFASSVNGAGFTVSTGLIVGGGDNVAAFPAQVAGSGIFISSNIWSGQGVSAATWSDVGGASSIWSDI